MSSRRHYVLPLPPSKNALHTIGRDFKTGKPRIINTPEYKSWLDLVAWTNPKDPIIGLVCVFYSVYVGSYHYEAHNVTEPVFDGLEGIAYEKDSKIIDWKGKLAGKDKDNPRCEVWVMPAAEWAAWLLARYGGK